MARAVRIEQEGGWYHVTARGNERRAIYRDNRDRQHFCALLAETVDRFRWVLHAFVLMDNHYHLLVETPEPNLSRAMQWLNVSYSVWFNRRHGRSGHLFQGRYKAIVVDPAGWGLELSRYVHLNPVRVGRLGLDKQVRQQDRAGIGGTPDPTTVRQRVAVLRRHRWSSYRAYIGLTKPLPWLHCERVLGGAEFVQRLRQRLRGNAREQPTVRRLALRPAFSAVVAAVERLKGERWRKSVRRWKTRRPETPATCRIRRQMSNVEM